MKSAVSGRNNMGPMQGFLFFDRLGRREAAGGHLKKSPKQSLGLVWGEGSLIPFKMQRAQPL